MLNGSCLATSAFQLFEQAEKILELPFNLWRYRHLSFGVSMTSLSLLQPIVLQTFRLVLYPWHHVSFLDKFTGNAVPFSFLILLWATLGFLIQCSESNAITCLNSCHVKKDHVIQTLRIYKDLLTFTSLASLLVGMRFNTLDVWGWDCTPNCENHAKAWQLRSYLYLLQPVRHWRAYTKG